MSMFTARHYNAIAANVATLPVEAREITARKLADLFLGDSERFDLARFLKACRIGQE